MLEISPELGEAYVRRFLPGGRSLSHWILDGVDLSRGVFEATVTPTVDSEGHWSSKSSNYDGNLADVGARFLSRTGRAVLFEDAIVNQKMLDGDADLPGGLAAIQVTIEGGYESYFLLSQTGDIKRAVTFRSTPHLRVGAFLQGDGLNAPSHRGVVNQMDMEELFRRIKGFFMRATSYDGYLFWWEGAAP